MIKEVLLKQFQKIRLKICWKIIRSEMQYSAKSSTSKKQKVSSELLECKEYTLSPIQSVSIADDMRKLARLKKKKYKRKNLTDKTKSSYEE